MKARTPLMVYPLFWIALAAAVGIISGRFFPCDYRVLLGAAIVCLGSTLVVRGWKETVTLLLATCFIFQFYAQVQKSVRPQDDLRNILGEQSQSGEMVVKVLDLPLLKIKRDGESRVEFRAQVSGVKQVMGDTKADGEVLVVVRQPSDLKLVPGQILRVAGFWQRPNVTINPGEFDYATFLKNKGIYYILKSTGDSVQELEPSRDPLGLVAYALRDKMLRVLKIGLEDDPQISGLMSGMLFGYKEGIASDLEEAFRVTGTLHLFAVSGQNVGVILGILILVLQASGMIRWRWAWIVLPVLLIFCLATGMQSSAMRAFMMAALILVAWALYRPVNILNVLGLAALGIWVMDPAQIFDVGFQLSFLVVLGMVIGTEPLLDKFYTWGKLDPWIPVRLISTWRRSVDRCYWVCCGVVASSLCAWLASQILILSYFNLFAPITLLANIVVMPLAALILTCSALSVAGSFLTSAWPLLLNQVNWLALKGLVAVIEFLAVVPGGHFYVAAPWALPPAEEASFTLFQSRQACPIVLQTGGHTWFVDSGTEYVWGSAINRFRQQQGVNEATGVILTQAGADHMGGMSELMKQISSILWAEAGFRSKSQVYHRWLADMEAAGQAKQFWRQGDVFSLGGEVWVEVLWPPAERVSERQEDQGLVLRFTKKGAAILVAGDISETVEQRLLASGKELRADVLIQGEHSVLANLGEDWLAAVSPRWLVRPARGFHPDRGMTYEKTNFLKLRRIAILKMEQTGALQFRINSDGETELKSWSSQEQSFK